MPALVQNGYELIRPAAPVIWRKQWFSDTAGEKVDTYDWIAEGALAAAAIRSISGSDDDKTAQVVSLQEFSRPRLKPWAYFIYFSNPFRRTSDLQADYRYDVCDCIVKDPLYPACHTQLVFGAYNAQVNEYLHSNRCVMEDGDYSVSADQQAKFAKSIDDIEKMLALGLRR